jgi:hypothetical protein
MVKVVSENENLPQGEIIEEAALVTAKVINR